MISTQLRTWKGMVLEFPTDVFELHCWPLPVSRITGFSSGFLFTSPLFPPFAPLFQGFGSVSGEHWLGNEFVYQLTNQRQYALRVELIDWDAHQAYSQYDRFHIGTEKQNYRYVFLLAFELVSVCRLNRHHQDTNMFILYILLTDY